MESKYESLLWYFFSLLYFADVITTSIALYVWNDGNLKEINPFMQAITDSCTTFIIVKLIVFVAMWIVYERYQKYTKHSIAILSLMIAFYGIVQINNCIWLFGTYQMPVMEGYINIAPGFITGI